ncbi:MAG: hypothetical protein HQ449_04335 [Chitinophagaceae bacterium]|nr:hypothetical protein [Chitinophagaceae bacterium]
MYLVSFIKSIGILTIKTFSGLKQSEKWATEYLHMVELKFDGKFDQKTLDKIVKRYSIQQHFINDSFSSLYGRNNNVNEKERNLLYFIMVSVYDDFLDDKTLTLEQIDSIFYHPEAFAPQTFFEKVFIYTHTRLLNDVADKAQYFKDFEGLHIAQKDSLEQFNPLVSDEALLSITTRKGGYCLLMCRHYLDTPYLPEADTTWYALGGVIQLTNDLYDIYKDMQEGIITLAIKAKQYEAIFALYHKHAQALNESIRQLPVKSKRKSDLSIILNVIAAFGYVALDNLARLQGNNASLPAFETLARKELIIDMEKNTNRFKLLKFTYQNASL